MLTVRQDDRCWGPGRRRRLPAALPPQPSMLAPASCDAPLLLLLRFSTGAGRRCDASWVRSGKPAHAIPWQAHAKLGQAHPVLGQAGGAP